MSTSSIFGSDYYPNPSIESQMGITTAPLSTPQNTAIAGAMGQAPGAFSVFNPSVSSLMNMIQGNFPGLDATTGNMMSSLFSTLWGAAQPQLQQGQQAINSQATGYGQAGASAPAATETSNLYQGVLSNTINDVMNAGVGQYNTDLGLTNAATNIGLQLPGAVNNQLLTTGGLEQSTAQNALNNLYQIYGQQVGLNQADLSSMLGLATGGTQLPFEAPTQYGQSGFQELLGAATSLLPFSSGLSGIGNIFSGLFGNTPATGPSYADLTTADRTSPLVY